MKMWEVKRCKITPVNVIRETPYCLFVKDSIEHTRCKTNVRKTWEEARHDLVMIREQQLALARKKVDYYATKLNEAISLKTPEDEQ